MIDLGSGGSVKGYLKVMQDIWAMADDKTRIIPGHGDMATKADLKKQIDMLTGAIAVSLLAIASDFGLALVQKRLTPLGLAQLDTP